MRSEGLCYWKIPVTPFGIEAAIFNKIEFYWLSKSSTWCGAKHLMLCNNKELVVRKTIFIEWYYCILIISNKMQQYAGIYWLQNHSTCFRCPLHPSSGVHETVTSSGTGHSIWATTFLQRGQFGHVGGRLLLRYYDLYQRLQLQFYVLLMMGAMETWNM